MTLGASLSVAVTLADETFSLDVRFDVPPGVTVLFGPSGAGKTRTLHAIAGLAAPDRGRITLGQETWFDATTGTNLAIDARRVALVFQSLALFPHMTAAENVSYGIARTVAAHDRDRRARVMLDRMHVAHLAERRPRTFSGGEAQRVALARAFAMRPRVLLLDEPFSALDDDVKGRLVEETRSWIEQEEIPTILVTHDEREARALGQRTVRIAQGRTLDE